VTGIVGGVNDPLFQRCSGFARAEALDPAGTAGSYRGYVALDVPLPWLSEITDHPEISPAAAALKAAGVRLQGVVPDPERPPASRRMVTFLRPDGPFDGYRTAAWTVPADGVTDALLAVAASVGATVAAAGPDGSGGHAGPATPVPGSDGAGRYVLVCTHGKRDACCGSLGTRLATALPGLGADVHVWRTSHTGGHRFAPTALLLPEGTAWAYLDLDALVGISDRTLDVHEAARFYRGCMGLDEPEVQAAEREALRTVGWSWLDLRREGRVLGREGGRTRVCLEGTAPDGGRTTFVATVEVARLVPVPDCGKPPEDARKSAPELRVSAFRAA
jgi:hypothetical protein